jgi:hypothetical protein
MKLVDTEDRFIQGVVYVKLQREKEEEKNEIERETLKGKVRE